MTSEQARAFSRTLKLYETVVRARVNHAHPSVTQGSVTMIGMKYRHEHIWIGDHAFDLRDSLISVEVVK